MDKRTERLLALVLLLASTRRPMSRDAIRDAIQEYQTGTHTAFERKFERDKDELRGMGIPIEHVTDVWDECDAYQLERRAMFLPEVAFSPSEQVALGLAARAWGDAAWSDAALNGLRKLEAAGDFVTSAVAELRVEGGGESKTIAAVMAAIDVRQAVKFSYRKVAAVEPETRHVEPWAIASLRGRWYLIGLDRDRAAQRVFRMSRIEARVDGVGPRGSYEIPDGIDISQAVKSQWDEGLPVTLSIRIGTGTGHALRSMGTVVEQGEGADLVRVDRIRPNAAAKHALRLGASAVVVEPEGVRESVVGALRRVVDAVESSQSLSAQARAELSRARAKPSKPGADSARRLARLLAVIPWLASHPGIPVTAAAEHFAMAPEHLREDLDLVVCTEFGAFLSTIDIDFYGSTITVHDPQGIDRPTRLSPEEASALLVGLRILGDATGDQQAGLVEQVANKLKAAAASLGDSVERIQVLNPVQMSTSVESAVMEGLTESRALAIRYWSAARDVVGDRTVDPIRISWSDGVGYLEAWCRLAQDHRTFRLDRIRSAEVLDGPSSAPPPPDAAAVSPRGPGAILLVEPQAAWLVEQVPHDAAITLPDGCMAISLPIASQPWAVRMLMSMGGAVRVVEPDSLARAVKAEARAALRQYESDSSPLRVDLHRYSAH